MVCAGSGKILLRIPHSGAEDGAATLNSVAATTANCIRTLLREPEEIQSHASEVAIERGDVSRCS